MLDYTTLKKTGEIAVTGPGGRRTILPEERHDLCRSR